MIKVISKCAVAVLLISNSANLFANKAINQNGNTVANSAMTDPTVYTEDKQNISVSPNQPVFIVKLKSNPTTGYSWFLREYNSNLIDPVKHSYVPPTSELVGASGYELWTFKVKPAGFVVPQQTAIRMMYARPWQDADNSGTQTVFHITTQVK